MCINEGIQIFERNTFRNLLVLLDTFDLLAVDFILYHLKDESWSLVGFHNSEFCFAVTAALTSTVLPQGCVEKTGCVYKANNSGSW